MHRSLGLWALAAALTATACSSGNGGGFMPIPTDASADDTASDVVAPPDDASGDVSTLDGGPRCVPGQMICDGVCTSVQTDSMNCGTCGNACPTNMACQGGACHHMCTLGLSACPADPDAGVVGDVGAEVCVDLQNSRLNCGSCGHACPAGQNCGGGHCYLDCGSQTLCPGTGGDAGVDGGGGPYCADLTFQHDNCGACGHACTSSELCMSGTCVINCTFPQMTCVPDGGRAYCANLNTDAMNCGSCGHACAAGQTCVSSTCTCASPFTACGAACVDTRTDAANCGACGRACAAGSYCSGSVCVACTSPRSLCPGGVCTDLTTDVSHCGSCTNSCHGAEVCSAGSCSCPTGATVCSGLCTFTANDPLNCGTCGHACPAGMGCLSGTCGTTTRYMQVNSPAGVSFIDACSAPGATTYLAGADDSYASVPLPFAFRYWTTNLAAGAPINITSNGWLGMDGMPNASLFGTVPSTSAPNAVIAPHWGDDHNGTPGQCVATIGAAPNRKWVAEWQNDYYCCSMGSTSLTYEVILSETTGTIDFVFSTMTGARAETMGIEDFTGSMGINACAGGASSCTPTTGQTIRFQPIP